MAELPYYRAHVVATLGPSLSMLDNRPVTEEERRLPDPLARGRGGGDSSPRPGSPAEGGSGPQPVLQLASGEGRWEQVRPVRILGCGQSAASCTPVPIAQSSVG
jgi:hypothetical protein